MVRFRRLTDEEVEAALEADGAPHDLAQTVASLAAGNLREARKMLDEEEWQTQKRLVEDFFKAVRTGDPADVDHIADELQHLARHSEDKSAVANVLHLALLALRTIFREHRARTFKAADFLSKFTHDLPPLDGQPVMRAFREAVHMLERNVYIPLISTSLILDIRRAELSPASQAPPATRVYTAQSKA